jgi:hypothetical protein
VLRAVATAAEDDPDGAERSNNYRAIADNLHRLIYSFTTVEIIATTLKHPR